MESSRFAEKLGCGLLALAAVALLAATAGAAPARAKKKSAKATTSATPQIETAQEHPQEPRTVAAEKDDSYTLRGGEEGTAFKSLTVEGEDRIQIEFDRPDLNPKLDPASAPGLDWGSARDILDRTVPDFTSPLVALSAHQPSPYVGRPWLGEFASGAVARFHPAVKDVERWKLVVANAKGLVVATFEGKGEPPKEIAWDGRSNGGGPIVPGLTYSYVFEAYDRAGNKRNFVGEGFRVSAYRLDTPDGPLLVFSGHDLASVEGGGWNPAAPAAQGSAPTLILEAASWLNQSPRIQRPIRVSATARSFEQANHLATAVARSLSSLVLGDAARVQATAVVEPDAPTDGTLMIAYAK